MPYSRSRFVGENVNETKRGTPLTQDEERAIKMLCEGRDVTQIAAAVGNERGTICRRLHSARIKLGAATYPELAVKWDRSKRIEPKEDINGVD